ncbi:MAG: helicase HerA domain-containing protein [Candidatus Asgardarchaeia archaeon]
MSEEDIVGRCIGESTPSYVTFISKKMPRVGEYVVIEFDGRKVLGLVTFLVRGNIAISSDIYDPEIIERIKAIEGEDYYIRGVVRILGDVENLEIPKVPPPPGTIIHKATRDILGKIFWNEKTGIKIGRLISHPDVEVYIDANKMISRHLAILAVTGAGKSNTVAIIVDQLLKIGGCVLIFDMHSEYVTARFENGRVNKIRPSLNPRLLSLPELEILMNIPSNAFIQLRYLRKAYSHVKELMQKNKLKKPLIEEMKLYLQALLESGEDKKSKKLASQDRSAVAAVLNKLDDLTEKYKHIIDEKAADYLNVIHLGEANVIDLGSVDEDFTDVIVSHVLRRLLSERKRYKRFREGFPYPIFVVIEEAHILAPGDRTTLSKYWISRIAREGRKFGIGLCLVSQRPKAIDANTLSQVNNMIILKLVEPTDQQHVQKASEVLTKDLMDYLASLNPGEAIVLGMMTKIPALVKIDEFKGKSIGQDIDIVGEWKKALEEEEKKRKDEIVERDEILGCGDW